MRLRSEILFTVGALVGIQLFTSLVGLGMLERMSPAVGRILADNVASKEAVQDMLAVLAAPGPTAAADFDAALARAEGNVTELAENAPLQVIRREEAAALAGEPSARLAVVEALAQLGAVNLASMRAADDAARRLGRAGAWTAALLGVLGFGLSIASTRRLHSRVAAPLGEIESALAAWRGGQLARRCAPLDAPVELQVVRRELNALLDRACGPPPGAGEGGLLLRVALIQLLDREAGPAVVVDGAGAVVVANAAALSLPAAARGPRAAGWVAEALPEGLGAIWRPG
jgi:hypothetical protein